MFLFVKAKNSMIGFVCVLVADIIGHSPWDSFMLLH